jgi:hypothetical protein
MRAVLTFMAILNTICQYCCILKDWMVDPTNIPKAKATPKEGVREGEEWEVIEGKGEGGGGEEGKIARGGRKVKERENQTKEEDEAESLKNQKSHVHDQKKKHEPIQTLWDGSFTNFTMNSNKIGPVKIKISFPILKMAATKKGFQ